MVLRVAGDPLASSGRREMMESEALWVSLVLQACRGCQVLLGRRARLETWDPWVRMELQALGAPLDPVDQRAPQGCLEE